MPIITAIAPAKQGGATTLAAHLAHALALTGLETLLIDLNPNLQTSYRFGCIRHHEELSSSSLFKCAVNNTKFDPNAVVCGIRRSLHLLPAAIDLPQVLAELDKRSVKDPDYLIVPLVSQLSVSFDAVIIDCAPDLNIASRNALTAASQIMSPVHSVSAVLRLRELMLSALNIELAGSWGAVLSHLSPTNKHEELLLRDQLLLTFEELAYSYNRSFTVAEERPNLSFDIFKAAISRSKLLAMWTGRDATVFDNMRDHLNDNEVARQFMTLAEEVSSQLLKGRSANRPQLSIQPQTVRKQG
jgi:hypothetical protein